MDNRYQRSGGAAITFFSILIAFGLQRLVDLDQAQGTASTDIADNKHLLFVISVTIFLRFLSGASVHLYDEYSEREGDSDRSRSVKFVFDIFMLSLFGYVAILSSYSHSSKMLLFWLYCFSALALVWSILRAPDPIRFRWIGLNFLMMLAILIVPEMASLGGLNVSLVDSPRRFACRCCPGLVVTGPPERRGGLQEAGNSCSHGPDAREPQDRRTRLTIVAGCVASGPDRSCRGV